MIVAVFCVAAAMIAGGAWAVFTGWEFIIIERGWTQVLLGGMLITGGLLLGGLGVLATHVKRLAGKLEGLPRSALTPTLVPDFGPGRKRDESAPQPSGPRTDAPIMPPPPPRPEPRVEPDARPVRASAPESASEPTEKPAGPAISAPAAIALGAAAGAGTAAIASALLSSGAPPRSEDEIAARDVEAESAESENADAPLRPLGAGGDVAATTALDAEIPTPDGEDVDMVWGTESPEEQDLKEHDLEAQNLAAEALEAQDLEAQDLEAEALEAEAAKVDGLHVADREDVRDVAREPTVLAERLRAEQDEAEHDEAEQDEAAQDEAEQDEAEPVIPPIEEPAAVPEPEPEPEVEPEERYSPPEAAQQPAAADLAEPLSEEDVREAEPRPADLSQASIAEAPVEAPVEEPPATPLEEPVEEPERTLVGTYESGGNIYTMYSDGSIDARTPTGDYHFASLEELKNFIAQGGEDPLA